MALTIEPVCCGLCGDTGTVTEESGPFPELVGCPNGCAEEDSG